MGEGPVGAEGIEVVRDGDGAADVDVVGRGRPLESGHMPFGQAGGLRREEQEGEECGVCHDRSTLRWMGWRPEEPSHP